MIVGAHFINFILLVRFGIPESDWGTLISNRKLSFLSKLPNLISVIPNITKNPKFMKWAPTIIAFWTTYIGARNLPLTYLILEDPAVTQPPLALEIDHPYTAPNDIISSELVERVTHIHTLFTTDNQVLYGRLEESTRLSFADSTVTQYKNKIYGRASWKAIMSAHCSACDWEDDRAG